MFDGRPAMQYQMDKVERPVQWRTNRPILTETSCNKQCLVAQIKNLDPN